MYFFFIIYVRLFILK